MKTLKQLPLGMGEADVIKSTLLLPGVQSVGEASGGFNVRGGSTDQNLILLSDAPILNTSHFLVSFQALILILLKILLCIRVESLRNMGGVYLQLWTSR